MSKSERPGRGELVRASRVIGECRDLANDCELWRRHCMEGLRGMFGAFTVTGGEGVWRRPGGGPPPPRQFVAAGMSAELEQFVLRFLRGAPGLREDPFFQAVGRDGRRLISYRREQLVDKDEWYASPVVMDFRRPAGTDDVMNSTLRFRPDGSVNVITLQRAWGDRPFRERQRRLLHVFHWEIGRLIQSGTLATLDTPGLRGLPPRPRQTLALLVRGMTHREIADELGIKEPTVRDYVDVLHAHFGVSSTPALIGAYLGRNRLPPLPQTPPPSAPTAAPPRRGGSSG